MLKKCCTNFLLVFFIASFFAILPLSNSPVHADNDIKVYKMLDVPYLHQIEDTPSHSSGAKLSYNSCMPVSSVMITAFYNRIPLDAINLAIYKEYSIAGFTFTETSRAEALGSSITADWKGAHGFIVNSDGYGNKNWARAYFRKHGLKTYDMDNPTIDLIVQHLKEGRPVLMGTKLTRSGHIVAVRGFGEYNGKTVLIANDPFRDYYTPSQLLKNNTESKESYFLFENLQDITHATAVEKWVEGDSLQALYSIQCREKPSRESQVLFTVEAESVGKVEKSLSNVFSSLWVVNSKDKITWWYVNWGNGKKGWMAMYDKEYLLHKTNPSSAKPDPEPAPPGGNITCTFRIIDENDQPIPGVKISGKDGLSKDFSGLTDNHGKLIVESKKSDNLWSVSIYKSQYESVEDFFVVQKDVQKTFVLHYTRDGKIEIVAQADYKDIHVNAELYFVDTDDDQEEIFIESFLTPKTYENMKYGYYKVVFTDDQTFIDDELYVLHTPTNKTINRSLTSTNPNQRFIAKYKKVERGTISIHLSSGTETLYANVSLVNEVGVIKKVNSGKDIIVPVGKYKVLWPEIDGYELLGSESSEWQELRSSKCIKFQSLYKKVYKDKGTLHIVATLDGKPWSGGVEYAIIGPSSSKEQRVPRDVPGLNPGSYSISVKGRTGPRRKVDGFTQFPNLEIVPTNVFIVANAEATLTLRFYYPKEENNAGVVTVTSNINDAPFKIEGPGFSARSETPWSLSNASPGNWKITWLSKDGHQTPSPETQTLSANGSISFYGKYGNSDGGGGNDDEEPNKRISVRLIIHEGSFDGKVLSGVNLQGKDGQGNSFSGISDTNGVVLINGYSSGNDWQFSLTKNGYKSTSWTQSITKSSSLKAYITRSSGSGGGDDGGDKDTRVTLRLYVHENSEQGSVIPGVIVSGTDGKGQDFVGQTNDNGYCTITGYASGNDWTFMMTHTDYKAVSWSQPIKENCRRDAFFSEKYGLHSLSIWNPSLFHIQKAKLGLFSYFVNVFNHLSWWR
jgi:hypothetical protein